MEHLLTLYSLPYDPKEPVVCFDERPCFLIGDTLVPLPMNDGQTKREHYEYEKFGSCVLMVAVEPLAGRRFARVFKQRRKRDYAQFMKELALQYPEAERIHLVQSATSTRTMPARSTSATTPRQPSAWGSSTGSTTRPRGRVG